MAPATNNAGIHRESFTGKAYTNLPPNSTIYATKTEFIFPVGGLGGAAIGALTCPFLRVPTMGKIAFIAFTTWLGTQLPPIVFRRENVNIHTNASVPQNYETSSIKYEKILDSSETSSFSSCVKNLPLIPETIDAVKSSQPTSITKKQPSDISITIESQTESVKTEKQPSNAPVTIESQTESVKTKKQPSDTPVTIENQIGSAKTDIRYVQYGRVLITTGTMIATTFIAKKMLYAAAESIGISPSMLVTTTTIAILIGAGTVCYYKSAIKV
jgi:hypothetical protein